MAQASRPGERSPIQGLILLGFIGLTFFVAWLGALSVGTSVTTWYQTLAKPAWNPPDWLFAPVWTALYTLMALAAWLVWRADGWRRAAGPLSLWGLQLVLNCFWSVLFFGLRRPGLAFFEMLALWVAVAATTAVFYRRVPSAGWLMAPYVVWTTYAAAVNFAVWRMNV